MVVSLLSSILFVTQNPLLGLFGQLVLYKLIPIWPCLLDRSTLLVEIGCLVLLDVLVVQLFLPSLELCGHLFQSPTFNTLLQDIGVDNISVPFCLERELLLKSVLNVCLVNIGDITILGSTIIHFPFTDTDRDLIPNMVPTLVHKFGGMLSLWFACSRYEIFDYVAALNRLLGASHCLLAAARCI